MDNQLIDLQNRGAELCTKCLLLVGTNNQYQDLYKEEPELSNDISSKMTFYSVNMLLIFEREQISDQNTKIKLLQLIGIADRFREHLAKNNDTELKNTAKEFINFFSDSIMPLESSLRARLAQETTHNSSIKSKL